MAGNTIKTLENVLALASMRQKVVSKNIANINTEYYRRQEVTFDEFLSEGMKSGLKITQDRHIGGNISPELNDMNVKVADDPNTDFNSGINNVNIDQEMSELAENQILFKFASRKIASSFKTLQGVIKGNIS